LKQIEKKSDNTVTDFLIVCFQTNIQT